LYFLINSIFYYRWWEMVTNR